jgi:Glutathione S-transferase
MTIKLYTFGEAWGLADPSPFCLKLESFLRETGLAYELEPFDLFRTFRRAPKGKLPFIQDEDGSHVGDSSMIIDRLSSRLGIDLDACLDERQRATSHAFRRMLDEHTYWVVVYARWLDEPGWTIARNLFFADLPSLLRPAVAAWSRRRLSQVMQAQGLGRHSRDEIYALGIGDMKALAQLLGEDRYFFSVEQPTLLDLWAYAFVAQIIVPPIDSPLQCATATLANLVRHCERMGSRLYGRTPGADDGDAT